MKRRHLAVVTALALALATSAADASAQEASAPEAAPAAPVPAPAAPAVRVHVRTTKNKGTARLYIHRADGSYTLVCASPCTADVPGNSQLRVTLGNQEDDPHTFTLSADLGSEVDLEVRPASSGPLIGSIVLMGAGGVVALSGLAFIALSDLAGSSIGGRSTSATNRDVATTYKTTGFVMIGVGAAVAIAGFVWLLSRSHEPQVVDAPYREPQVYGRRETLLGDVALGKPRDPRSDAPVPFMPLPYGFSF
jgi:hypothetical protein